MENIQNIQSIQNIQNEQSEIFDLGGLSICVSRDHRFGTDAVLLADFAAESVKKGKSLVCDLCTGCGIIPLLLHIKKPPLKAYGIEIQEEAAELFARSVQLNDIAESVIPINADLRGEFSEMNGRMDIVTANPPYYIGKSGYERLSRAQAIARHEIMCCTDDVVKTASKLLKFGGLLKMCNIPERLTDVICAMRKYKVEPKKLILISQSRGEKPWLFLISGKKGGNSGMAIEYALTSEFDGVGQISNEKE